MTDLEKELFDNEDEIIVDEPVELSARFKMIQSQRQEILNLKFKLKQKDKQLSDLWGRYHGCRDVISFLIKDGDQRLDDLENHWSV